MVSKAFRHGSTMRSIARLPARACWILAASISAVTGAPAPGLAQAIQATASFDAPESQDLARIEKRLASGRPVRIVSQLGTRIVDSPRINADGVAWLAASDSVPDTLPAATMVRWTDIERLQTKGSAAGVGAAAGAAVVGGLALVVGISLSSDPFLGGNGAGLAAATAGGALFGAGVGALVGAAVPKWVNVHIGRTPRR